MRYFVEISMWHKNPVLRDENSLIDYALETYNDCNDMKDDYKDLLSRYTNSDLMDTDKALEFLNDRFSYNDIPFRECVLY